MSTLRTLPAFNPAPFVAAPSPFIPLSISAAPVVPSPSTTPRTAASAGTSARAARSGPTKRGVTSLGLISTAHPASKAGMASISDRRNGKFQGEMTPTTG